MMLQFKRQRLFRRRRQSTVSGNDGANFSDFALDGDDDDDSDASSRSIDSLDAEDEYDGPTIITVDDGKGGIAHITVSRPPDRQQDIISAAQLRVRNESKPDDDGEGVKTGNGSAIQVAPTGDEEQGTKKPKGGIGDLLKQELKGRHLFQLEPAAEKLRKRLVNKKGGVNIGTLMDKKQKSRYITDFFNTLLDMRWRYVLVIFTLSFFLSWLAFAAVWYVIVFLHGDLEPDHLPDRQEDTGWTPCVYMIHNFASAFLFSVETQHTIGYGSRQTTEECPEAIFLMSIQSVVGVMIQACMVGTIFAKLARPKKRAETIMFSKNAVVRMRDGVLCLSFRVANLRTSQLVETHTRAILITKKVTEEGEVIPYHQTELKVGTDLEGEEDELFFIWPCIITHVIDESSPFYGMNARDFLKKRYEIIVVLEGIVEPTGMSIQARSSYLPNEILWGYGFVNILTYKWREEQYKIDYANFNKVVQVETSTVSAKQLEQERTQQQQQQQQQTGNGGSGAKTKKSGDLVKKDSIILKPNSKPTIAQRAPLTPIIPEDKDSDDIEEEISTTSPSSPASPSLNSATSSPPLHISYSQPTISSGGRSRLVNPTIREDASSAPPLAFNPLLKRLEAKNGGSGGGGGRSSWGGGAPLVPVKKSPSSSTIDLKKDNNL